MKIGIYGGTFNPPHTGHIHAVRQAAEALKLDRLLLIPDRIAPHKEIPAHSPTPEQRLELLRCAVAGIPGIEVSDMELKREGPSYTYLTIEQLREAHPGDRLYLLMGTDMFLSFHTWKHPEKITAHASLAVMYRGSKGEAEAIAAKKAEMEESGAKILLVKNDSIPISSTQVRRLLAFQCGKEFLPGKAMDYIRAHGFYDTAADWKNLPMEALEPIVIRLLNPNRVAHVLGCRDTAVELAKRWGADENAAARAGLLHDITKALDGPLQLTLCQEYGTMLSEFDRKYPKTLHALTGSLVADRIFGESEAVVTAICHHTTGRANMTLLEKIIYVADYMEPNRDFPGVEELRRLAFADIDAALKLGLEMTLEHLKDLGHEVSPASRQALEYLNQKGKNHMLTAKEVALEVTKALDEKKGMDIKLLRIEKVSSLADYFLICTGTSNTHVKTLCDYAEYTMEQLGEPMLGREGHRGNSWELLDYGSVVVHVFTDEARKFYSLERLWADAEVVDLQGIVIEE